MIIHFVRFILYAKTETQKQKVWIIECPMDKKVFSESEIKTDFKHQQFLEAICELRKQNETAQKSKVETFTGIPTIPCDICKKIGVWFFCLDCPFTICQACIKRCIQNTCMFSLNHDIANLHDLHTKNSCIKLA